MRKRFSFVESIRPVIVGLFLLAVIVALLAFRLGNLQPGYSQSEATTIKTTNLSVDGLLEDSQFFAYRVAMSVLDRVDLLSPLAVRGLSAICGLMGAIAFYLLLKKWHTRRVALMGGLLFATSSCFLQASRVANPEAMYLLLPLLIYLGVKLDEGTQRLSVAVFSVALVTQLLYLPGMIWLMSIGVVWQRKRIIAWLREIHTAAVVFMCLLGLTLLAPLGFSLFTNPDFWQSWVAYPLHNQTPYQFVRQFVTLPWHVFIKHIYAPELHLGRLPILDIASSVFVLLGFYWYFFQRKLDRAKLILAGLVFGTFLTAATGLAAQVVLLPFLFILATGGITLMLQQWFTVFPRNPLARGVGLGLIITIVGLVGFYHVRRYFVAWPNSPDVRRVYSIQSDTIKR